MTTRNLISVAIGASLMLGCAGPTMNSNSATPMGASPLMACGMSDKTADTCEVKGNKTICHVYVGGNANAPFVYPYTLFVGTSAPDITIVWTLLDKNASFRDRNDGPNFSSNPEFSDPDTTDDPDGGSANGHAAKHYKVKYKNTPLGVKHRYSIKFKTNTGTVAECDPVINNTGV
jgi:hypothetical protein